MQKPTLVLVLYIIPTKPAGTRQCKLLPTGINAATAADEHGRVAQRAFEQFPQ